MIKTFIVKFCVKKALKPFEQIIKNITANTIAANLLNSRENILNICIDAARLYQEQIWKQVFDQYEINFKQVYVSKIKCIQDKKIK